MAKFPERLPHPPPVLQPRVLHEVGLADVAADRREEVDEGLQSNERNQRTQSMHNERTITQRVPFSRLLCSEGAERAIELRIA